MQTDSYKFKVGELECTVLKDAMMAYENPQTFLFFNAPQEQLAQALQKYDIELDQWNEWISPYNCLLIKAGSQTILVDTGMGSSSPPEEGDLIRRLEAMAVEPDDIDIVLITHAHGDHSGGNTDDSGNAAFRRARYIMHKAEWDFWTSKSVLEQPQHEWMVPVVHKNIKPLRERFELVEEDTEIVPGVNFVCAPGHTPGHMVVQISSAGEQLWYLSDAFLHPIHIEQPDWNADVDIHLKQAVQTRQTLLNQVANGPALVHGYHFPYPGLGHVGEDGEGYHWRPI